MPYNDYNILYGGDVMNEKEKAFEIFLNDVQNSDESEEFKKFVLICKDFIYEESLWEMKNQQ